MAQALGLPHSALSLPAPWCHSTSWGPSCISIARSPFPQSFRCVCDPQSRKRDVSPDSLSHRKKTMGDKLWRDFFSDPSQWWDNRSEKVNLRYPDFKHKSTGQGLWLNNNLTPPWVEAQLATMAPGLVQTHIFSWHVRLRRLVEAGEYRKTLYLFQQMQREDMMPDKFTFVAVLQACSNLRSLEEGRRVHQQIIQSGCESEIYVGNCLIFMYANCRSIEDALSVFNRMRDRDVVSWNAMIGGCVKAEQGPKALELFQEMQREGVEPDTVTFVGALNACASVVAFQQGRRVHKQIIQRGYESDVYVATCLVDMYAKCGSTKDARTVFNKMRERTVASWTAMIGGYAMHGHSKEAIELFEQMGKEGVEINDITFVCLLSACSHAGLVEKGLRYFNTMTSHYNVVSTKEHYVCMVDLLGRAGRLEEAEKMAEEMTKRIPMERDNCVWRCLLGACRIHGNIEMAERAAKRCWELDPKNASADVLLSNIYAAAGKWDRSAAIEEAGLKRKVRKVPGRTWIEVESTMHSFVVDDEEHPEILKIRAEFDRLLVQLNEEGYVPDRRFLSREGEEEDVECHLRSNSENGVIAYGVITTSFCTPYEENFPVLP